MSWSPYSDLALVAGASRCQIVGHTGMVWGTSDERKRSDPAPLVVRDLRALIKCVRAEQPTNELVFDGVKFTFINWVDETMLGKAGELACGVKSTANTVIIVIGKAPPQQMITLIAPVFKAVVNAGQ